MPWGLRNLSLLFAMLAGLVAPIAARAASIGDLEQLRRHAVELVNRARGEHGLPPLALAAAPNAAAQAHAEDMARRGYYAHIAPSGEEPRDRFLKAGGSAAWLIAENLARCLGCPPPPLSATVDSLQEGWMESIEHRRNILRGGLAEFGFGIAVTEGGTLYAVQVFAGPGQPVVLRPGEPQVALSASAQLAAALDQLNRLRKTVGRPPLRSSDVLSGAAGALLPDPSAPRVEFTGKALRAALAEGEQRQWRSLTALGAACAGCGTTPVAADIREFLQQWSQNDQSRALLESDAITHLGFAMAVDGNGRKVAVAVLGNRLGP